MPADQADFFWISVPMDTSCPVEATDLGVKDVYLRHTASGVAMLHAPPADSPIGSLASGYFKTSGFTALADAITLSSMPLAGRDVACHVHIIR